MLEPEHVKNKWSLKVFSGIILLFAVIEFGIGLGVYTFFESGDKYGGWWAMFAVFVSAGLGLASTNRNIVLTSSFFSIIAIVIVAVALVIDAVGFDKVSKLEECFSTSDSAGSGNNACSTATYDDANGKPECVCSSTANSANCYSYTLTYGDNCDEIATLYTNDLLASFAFLSFIVLLLFIYIILSCNSACASDSDAHYKTPSSNSNNNNSSSYNTEDDNVDVVIHSNIASISADPHDDIWAKFESSEVLGEDDKRGPAAVSEEQGGFEMTQVSSPFASSGFGSHLNSDQV